MKPPSTTKQGQSTTFLPMGILMAFLLLHMYNCSASPFMPGGHLWRSNTFFSAHKGPFQPLRRSVLFSTECWHNRTSYTTTQTNHLQLRKRVWMKPSLSITSVAFIMPSSSYVHASDPTAPSGDIFLSSEGVIDLILTKDDVDKFVAKMNNQAIVPIFDPPGPCPIAPGPSVGRRQTPRPGQRPTWLRGKKKNPGPRRRGNWVWLLVRPMHR
jgi:hypothetical protein